MMTVVVANKQMPWDGLSWGRMGARGFGGGFATRWDELPDAFLKNTTKGRYARRETRGRTLL